MHKSFYEGEIYFVANTIGEKQNIAINLPFENKNIAIFDPYDLSLASIEPNIIDNKMKFNLDISSNKAKLILLY